MNLKDLKENQSFLYKYKGNDFGIYEAKVIRIDGDYIKILNHYKDPIWINAQDDTYEVIKILSDIDDFEIFPFKITREVPRVQSWLPSLRMMVYDGTVEEKEFNSIDEYNGYLKAINICNKELLEARTRLYDYKEAIKKLQDELYQSKK
jgi:hypothetical protein